MPEITIPKVIHYCWFGQGKMPKLAVHCLKSWQKYCPEYTIKEWNESNFDVSQFAYTKEAYEAKKYAFVTDVVRLYALYHEGGIYMDTDVEVLKPFDDLLHEHAFSGFETPESIPTGIMASEKENGWVRDQLQVYDGLHFLKSDGLPNQTTNVRYITDLSLAKHGLKLNGKKQTLLYGMTLFPKEYFCPKDFFSGKIELSENTYTIHHFNGSWRSLDRKSKDMLIRKMKRIMGEDGYQHMKKFLHVGLK